MKTRRIFYAAADMAALFLFVYLLVFPQNAAEPTRTALEFCAKTLVPSLFIYMILAKIVITLPLTDKIAKKIGYEAVTLITGALCGCPLGAKTAVSLYETGRISKKHAEFLCSFTNNASVSFVLGFVGSELYGDIGVGLKLLLFQLIASVSTAVLMRFLMFGREKLPSALPGKGAKTGLREAVSDSALTMINVCACAVFFMVCGNAVSGIFHFNPTVDAILKSVLEFSSGCAAASKLDSFSLPITAFSIGLTGLSVALQVRSVAAGRLAMRPFLVGKVISCTVMTLLSVFCG